MQREPLHNTSGSGNAFKEESRRDCVKKTRSSHHYLAKELFLFARLEVESGKSHEQITKLRGAVAATLGCVVLVEKCWR